MKMKNKSQVLKEEDRENRYHSEAEQNTTEQQLDQGRNKVALKLMKIQDISIYWIQQNQY